MPSRRSHHHHAHQPSTSCASPTSHHGSARLPVYYEVPPKWLTISVLLLCAKQTPYALTMLLTLDASQPSLSVHWQPMHSAKLIGLIGSCCSSRLCKQQRCSHAGAYFLCLVCGLSTLMAS